MDVLPQHPRPRIESPEDALKAMQDAATEFYFRAIDTQCHAFVEFTGLMNEFIKLCRHTLEAGGDFRHMTTQSSRMLPMRVPERHYVYNKLRHIYGEQLFNTPPPKPKKLA